MIMVLAARLRRTSQGKVIQDCFLGPFNHSFMMEQGRIMLPQMVAVFFRIRIIQSSRATDNSTKLLILVRLMTADSSSLVASSVFLVQTFSWVNLIQEGNVFFYNEDQNSLCSHVGVTLGSPNDGYEWQGQHREGTQRQGQ
jgi:hypothetical protein